MPLLHPATYPLLSLLSHCSQLTRYSLPSTLLHIHPSCDLPSPLPLHIHIFQYTAALLTRPNTHLSCHPFINTLQRIPPFSPFIRATPFMRQYAQSSFHASIFPPLHFSTLIPLLFSYSHFLPPLLFKQLFFIPSLYFPHFPNTHPSPCHFAPF